MKTCDSFCSLLIAAAAIVMGTACSDDPVKQDPFPESIGVTELKASILNTRVEAGSPVGGLLPAVWSSGDRIAAAVGDRTCYYALTEGADTETAVFEFEGDKKEAPEPPFTLVYPAEPGTMPAVQTYVKDGFDPAGVILSAEAVPLAGGEPLAVTFTKGYSVLDLQLTGDATVVSIGVTDAEAALAGEANTVTLDCGDGVVLDPEAATDFRLLIAPGRHMLKIRIRTSDGRTKSHASAEALVFDAGAELKVALELQGSEAGFTSGPYKVGDYYFDGEAEGVVVEADPTGSKGKMIAMYDMPDMLTWGPDDVITSASDEEYGVPNMATVASIDPAYAAYPAFRACAEMGEGWYLPAQKEMQGVRKVLDAVNATLGWRGGSEIPAESLYWSSTEADSYMDATAFAADMEMPGMFGITKTQVLRVRAFREFGELPEAKYKVGALCEEEGKKGIVFWVSKDGLYARILSMSEQRGEWGPIGTATGAVDEYDGEKNLAAVKASAGSLDAYPAFRSCAEQGDGWYLPSLGELNALSGMYAALNTELARHGGDALQAAYYWSSTELGSDAANSAQSVLIGSGTKLASSKNVVRSVRAAAYVGTRPAGQKKYAVGDPYEVNDVVLGVVCAVSEDGLHGTVLALKNVAMSGRINAIWDAGDEEAFVAIGASNADDGTANLQAARTADPELANLVAFRLCADMGEGWYLPAENEMKALLAVKSDLDAALRANGGSALDSDEYWTSTEAPGEDAVIRAVSVNLKNGSTFNYRKYFMLRVRPMKRF